MRTLSQAKNSIKSNASIMESSASASASSEKAFVPMFVPMGSPKGDSMNCRGDTNVPVHTTDIITRKDVLEEAFDPSMHGGNFGGAYSAWVYSAVCFILMFVTWAYVSVYVAGVFAYLTGYFYSERLLNNAWGIGWLKGKTLMYAA